MSEWRLRPREDDNIFAPNECPDYRSLEGINKIKTGKLISLSEQQLLDCDRSENSGCHGGRMDNAFSFIVKNKGLATETDYPLKEAASDHTCIKTRSGHVLAKITGYQNVPKDNESALRTAVAQQPVSVVIDARGRNFQLYLKGVFNGECGTKLSHGVTVVGYGEARETKYWLVKNSWGASCK